MLRGLTILSVVATYALLILGGIVSSTGSGLGCGPDWPLCHGHLIPPFSDAAIFIEWFHRLLAAMVGLLVIATAIVAWRRAREFSNRPHLAGIAVVLLLTQIILGAITVRLELPPEASTAHLAMGAALLGILTMMATVAFLPEATTPPWAGNVLRLVWLAVGLTYVQLVLGGYVRHSGAGLACPDVPLCLGQVIPPLQGPVLGHFLHRVGGLLVLFFVHLAGSRVLRATQDPALRKASLIAMTLVLIQVGIGMLSVTTQLSSHVTTTHLAVALALLGVLIFIGTRMGVRSAMAKAVTQQARN